MVFAYFNSNAQAVKLSKILSNTQDYQFEENKLLMVEFWASWCLPCISASKQLQVIQDIYKNDIHIVAITKESESTALKYIKKHQPKLVIGLDYEGVSSERFNPNGTLPYAVLINQKNQVIWRGNPLSLTHNQIAVFIRNNLSTNRLPISDRLEIKEIVEMEPKLNLFQINKTNDITEFYQKDDYTFHFRGKLSYLLKDLLNIPDDQFNINKDYAVEAQISNKYLSMSFDSIYGFIKKIIPIELSILSSERETYILSTNSDKMFWDTNQLDWGSSINMYLKGEVDIKINNATLRHLSIHLSNILNKTVVLDRNYSFSNNLYDWQLVYKFKELLISDLKNNYGINLIAERREVPIYKFNLSQ